MNPYQAYKRHRETTGKTRIDEVLELYDGAIGQLKKSLPFLKADQRTKALPHLANAQLLIMGLASIAPVDRNKELADNLLRLFDFCVARIAHPKPDSVEDAIKVLEVLRKGYETVRPDVANMERSGKIRPAGSLHIVQGLA